LPTFDEHPNFLANKKYIAMRILLFAGVQCPCHFRASGTHVFAGVGGCNQTTSCANRRWLPGNVYLLRYKGWKADRWTEENVHDRLLVFSAIHYEPFSGLDYWLMWTRLILLVITCTVLNSPFTYTRRQILTRLRGMVYVQWLKWSCEAGGSPDEYPIPIPHPTNLAWA